MLSTSIDVISLFQLHPPSLIFIALIGWRSLSLSDQIKIYITISASENKIGKKTLLLTY